jgi:hypothetical protein
MKQFINWGQETPEQLEKRRQFEEEQREFMINKMLMEAARNQSSSAKAAIGGGGGGLFQSIVTEKTAILVYYNETNNLWEYFTANPASLTFSDTVQLDVDPNSSFETIYPINQSGYVIMFNEPEEVRTVICVSANGDVIGKFTQPTGFDYGLRNGKVFYTASLNESTIWVFDGTTLRKDEVILSGSGINSFEIGTSDQSTTLSNKLIVQVVISDDINESRQWWAVGTDSSNLIFTDEYSLNQEYAQVKARFNSDYLVVEYFSTVTNDRLRIEVIDLSGQEILSEDMNGQTSVDSWFYGTQEAILILLESSDELKVISFDPTSSQAVETYEYARNPGDEYSVRVYTAETGGNLTNSPANAFAVAIYQSIGDSIDGNMVNTSGVRLIAKFNGNSLFSTLLEVDYANIYDYSISDTAIVIPVSVDGTLYQIYKVLNESNPEFINGISYEYGEGAFNGISFDRVANGFLLEVAYDPTDSSIIHFIGSSGEFSQDHALILPGVQYNSNESTDWYDESGPLLYYVNLDNTVWAWLPDLEEWQSLGSGSVASTRYSTRAFSSPDFRDGSNYLLIKDKTRLYWFNDQGTNGIDDGGDDMYDGGNEIYSSSLSIPVPYTHTQMELADDEDEATSLDDFQMDGQIQSGEEFALGQESEYFTNLYPGLFVMSVVNAETDQFKIDGNIGTDGNGQVDSGQIALTEPGYTLFYKRVWGTSDPSINQLIIVKATDSELITQEIDPQSEDDTHMLTGLLEAGVTQIHYLLFALAEGIRPDLADIEDLANQYVSLLLNTETHEEFLSSLNQGYSDLLEILPAHTASGSFDGILVSRSAVTEFNILATTRNTVRLGTNGLYILGRVNDLYKIDHYSLTGQLISSISTEFDDYDDNHYVADRGLVILDGYTEETESRIRAIFLFNETGYARRDINEIDSYEFSLNDYAWWD